MIKNILNKLKSKKRSLIVILATILGVGGVGMASKYWLGDDNFIEEKAEEIIEKNTGFSFDLSPSSKEYTDKFFRAS